MAELAIFDLDGTLADRDSVEIYPEMADLLRSLAGQGVKIALATNQGGPACRNAGWSWSANFPSYDEVQARLELICSEIEAITGQPPHLEVCWAYRTKAGQLIFPDAIVLLVGDVVHWESLRKPNPGMLLAAMEWAGATPDATTMYGDSDDDEAAATAAGIKFVRVEKGIPHARPS